MFVEAVEDTGALVGEDALDWALLHDFAFRDADDLGVEEEALFEVVRDGEYGDAPAAEPGLERGGEFVAEGGVEAGEGLVEQEEGFSGAVKGDGGEDGSGDGDTLALAAAEVGGGSLDEGAEAKEAEDLVEDFIRDVPGVWLVAGLG